MPQKQRKSLEALFAFGSSVSVTWVNLAKDTHTHASGETGRVIQGKQGEPLEREEEKRQQIATKEEMRLGRFRWADRQTERLSDG